MILVCENIIILLFAEVEEYCRRKQSVCMENRVTSTSKLDQADQGFSSLFPPVVFPPASPLLPQPPTSEVSITPIRSTVTPPAIFRPPGLQDSDEENDEAEDIKPNMSDMMNTTTTFPTTFPTSYPSMLRLLHPHLYRHYHPYLHYTNTVLGYQGHYQY